MLTESHIQKALSLLKLPYTNQDVKSLKVLKSVVLDGDTLALSLQVGFPLGAQKAAMALTMQQHLQQALPDLTQIDIDITTKIKAHQVQSGVKANPVIKNVIAVASGKGGVGKSTTTVNLALACQQLGARVGILDADIHGPNQPHMLGVTDKPDVSEDKKFTPVMAYELQTMSIGYLIDPTQPMVWRGPMVSGALKQLFNDTLWQPLDYLFVDMPPGTGDIQLTLAKNIPVSGVVIVTTPQDIALLDARKGLEMFRKVKVPVLGVIENMSMHECSQCGHHEPLFGEHGAQQLAADCEVPLLGKLPLAMSIRQAVDQGRPTVVAEPESQIAALYREIALQLTAKLSMQANNYAVKFPPIVVE